MDRGPARYDDAAGDYVRMFGDRVDDPATATLFELLGDVRGTRLLDAPCGEAALPASLRAAVPR